MTSSFWETGDHYDRFRAFFRPVVSLTYVADYTLWQLRPVGYHLTNVLLHVACLGVLWVGFSWTALAVAVALYAFRMFAITGFYHRYFSHKSFRASRGVQFLMAFAGALAVQKGPLAGDSSCLHF